MIETSSAHHLTPDQFHLLLLHSRNFSVCPFLTGHTNPVVLDEVVMKEVHTQPLETVAYIPGETHRLPVKLRDIFSHLPVQIVHRKQIIRQGARRL